MAVSIKGADDDEAASFSVFSPSVSGIFNNGVDEDGSIEVYDMDTFELMHTVVIEPDYEKSPGRNLLRLGPIGVSSKTPNDYKLIYEV
jgi:hypothetical protein